MDRRLDRLRTRAKALSLMQSYFSIWKSKVEEKHEAKDKQHANQVRNLLILGNLSTEDGNAIDDCSEKNHISG